MANDDSPSTPRWEKLLREYYDRTSGEIVDVKIAVQKLDDRQRVQSDGMVEHATRLGRLESWRVRDTTAQAQIHEELKSVNGSLTELRNVEERRAGMVLLVKILFVLGVPTVGAILGGIIWLVRHAQ